MGPWFAYITINNKKLCFQRVATLKFLDNANIMTVLWHMKSKGVKLKTKRH
jgi:hypothetical protein